MPPIPPISGIAIVPGSEMSATTASVVRNRAATDAAFCNAERVTFAGSTTPASIMFTHSPVAALKPIPISSRFRRSTMIEPSRPALFAIWRTGSSSARRMMRTPVATSPSTSSRTFVTAPYTFSRAVPPPDTIPSSTAARVELRASSMRSLRSFNSVSVAAPTLMTATPPANFARRSCNFSLSNSEVVSAS